MDAVYLATFISSLCPGLYFNKIYKHHKTTGWVFASYRGFNDFFLRRIDIKNTIIINARATMALIPNGGARERTKGAKPPLIQQV